ncbi:MAG TPA: hypothetical protein VLJ88_17065 [Propionibacteriaceae bacterium]|nr:hypothetical protein [Propionibacteriaceae bacterium]
MTVVEANPDHNPDGTSIRRLVDALSRSLAARAGGGNSTEVV